MKSVIIIDDDSSWSTALSDGMISLYEFKVIASATTGREGKLLIEHYRPDLITLDIMMPEDDGLSVLKHIRSISSQYNPFIYVITALNTPAIHTMLKDLGVDFIDYKPVSVSKIVETLKQVDFLTNENMEKKKGAPAAEVRSAADVIEEVLMEIGVPEHLSGYRYMKAALFFMLDNPDTPRELYATVSSVCNCSYSSVDRNMRTAIAACAKTKAYHDLFGGRRTSNLHFLYRLLYVVKKRLREKNIPEHGSIATL